MQRRRQRAPGLLASLSCLPLVLLLLQCAPRLVRSTCERSFFETRLDGDLGTFEASGISVDDVVYSQSYPCGGYAVTIKDNVMHALPLGWETEDQYGRIQKMKAGTNHPALDWMHRALCKYKVPDVSFVINVYDKPCREDVDTPRPLISWGKTDSPSDHQIMMPYWSHMYLGYQASLLGLPGPKWEDREDKAFFRGTTTGGIFEKTNWDEYPRTKLVQQCMNSSVCDAKFSGFVQIWDEAKTALIAMGAEGAKIGMADWAKYRYIIMVDGNLAPSSRMAMFLHLNSVLLWQESHNLEFFYDMLVPYVHYIPVTYLLGDVRKKIGWAQRHQETSKEIAANALGFARAHLTEENFLCYMRRLLVRYAAAQRFTPSAEPLLLNDSFVATKYKC